MNSFKLLLASLSFVLLLSSSSSSSDLCTESSVRSAHGRSAKTIKVVVDEGENRSYTMTACAYDIHSIEREATYFCETHSAKLALEHCKTQIARLLRDKFRQKSSTCESIFSAKERSNNEVLKTFEFEISNQGKKIHVPLRENDDIHEFVNRWCGNDQDEQCVAHLFKIMFEDTKTRARAVDAFIASCNENTVPSSHDLSGTFAYSQFGKNRVVDEALPRSIFCLLAAESIVAFRMMSSRKQPISHFLKFSDMYRRGPRSGIELAVEYLLHLNFPNMEDRENLVGVEWWIQHRIGDTIVPFHFDKDEGYTKRESKATMKHPSLSTLLKVRSDRISLVSTRSYV